VTEEKSNHQTLSPLWICVFPLFHATMLALKTTVLLLMRRNW